MGKSKSATPANKTIVSLTNPVRARIIHAVADAGQLSAKQLMEKLTDVPQPTLYRHISAMCKDGLLEIVGQKQVRGAVERTYQVCQTIGEDIAAIIKNNDGEAYLQLFLQYLMPITGEFVAYSQRSGISLEGDMSGFSLAPVCATDEEFVEALTKISEIIVGLVSNAPAPGRKHRNLYTIIAPPRAQITKGE